MSEIPLTNRDEFAIRLFPVAFQILRANLGADGERANIVLEDAGDSINLDALMAAEKAYLIADAMMEARFTTAIDDAPAPSDPPTAS